ncbi:MAG: hypothetical protein WD847_17385 [Pirellulales bacterium]
MRTLEPTEWMPFGLDEPPIMGFGVLNGILDIIVFVPGRDMKAVSVAAQRKNKVAAECDDQAASLPVWHAADHPWLFLLSGSARWALYLSYAVQSCEQQVEREIENDQYRGCRTCVKCQK